MNTPTTWHRIWRFPRNTLGSQDFMVVHGSIVQYKIGEDVDHPKYGKGKVEHIQQNQDSVRLHIRFKEELKIIDQGWILRTKYKKRS